MRTCSLELVRAAQQPVMKSVRRFAALLAVAVALAKGLATAADTGRIVDSAIAGAAGVS